MIDPLTLFVGTGIGVTAVAAIIWYSDHAKQSSTTFSSEAAELLPTRVDDLFGAHREIGRALRVAKVPEYTVAFALVVRESEHFTTNITTQDERTLVPEAAAELSRNIRLLGASLTTGEKAGVYEALSDWFAYNVSVGPVQSLPVASIRRLARFGAVDVSAALEDGFARPGQVPRQVPAGFHGEMRAAGVALRSGRELLAWRFFSQNAGRRYSDNRLSFAVATAARLFYTFRYESEFDSREQMLKSLALVGGLLISLSESPEDLDPDYFWAEFDSHLSEIARVFESGNS